MHALDIRHRDLKRLCLAFGPRTPLRYAALKINTQKCKGKGLVDLCYV